MKHRLLTNGLGALAIVGAFVIVLNVAVNLGVISPCDAVKENFVASPDGKHSVVLGIAKCGNDRVHLTARLLPSSDAGTLFSADAPGSDFVLIAQWNSQSELEIIYPRNAEIRYPPNDSLDGLHDRGAVQVMYLER
jgi:hypothetical protein